MFLKELGAKQCLDLPHLETSLVLCLVYGIVPLGNAILKLHRVPAIPNIIRTLEYVMGVR